MNSYNIDGSFDGFIGNT